MDLIVLPGAAPAGTQLSRLNDLLAWLAADTEPVDVYLFAPADPSGDGPFFDFVRALQPVPGFAYLVVPSARIDHALLARIEENGIAYVIVDDDGIHEVESALSGIASYFDATPDSSLMLGVWSELGGAGIDRQRLLRWSEIGIAPEVVRPRPFPRGVSDAAAIDVPPQLLANLLGCALYTGTLTIDAAGCVRACPRDTAARAADLGDLNDAPEELIVRRAQNAPRVGELSICHSCTAHGRFSWLLRRGDTATTLWNAGRPSTASNPSPRVLPAAAEDDVDATLRDFEQRLEQWSRDEQGATGA